MATFPTSPSPTYGASKSSAPSTRVVQFGDGYEQRIVSGSINNDAKQWSLNWSNISEADADTLEAFLEARKGIENFDWTPPDTDTAYKWVCGKWTKSIPYNGRANISATFRQVFEP